MYVEAIQLNNSGDHFNIWLFPGKAGYTTSAALGSVTGAFGLGALGLALKTSNKRH